MPTEYYTLYTRTAATTSAAVMINLISLLLLVLQYATGARSDYLSHPDREFPVLPNGDNCVENENGEDHKRLHIRLA